MYTCCSILGRLFFSLIPILMIHATLMAEDFACITPGNNIRVAVIYSKDWKGGEFLRGVETAFERARESDLASNACIEERYAYRGDAEGEDHLIELVQSGKVDIVLGPSDSGVYLSALDRASEFEDKTVPVISSLVTVGKGNDAENWFFRTNIDDSIRIWSILDSLEPLWVTSLGLLYSDSAYGISAEKAFKDTLDKSTTTTIYSYTPIPFGGDQITKRDAVMHLMEIRPEVIGIIGLIDDVTVLRRMIKDIGQSNSYKPIVFTIIDASYQREEIDDIVFTSITDPRYSVSETSNTRWEENFEVTALSHDTTWMVLKLLEGLERKKFNPTSFRDDLVNWLDRGSESRGPTTGMKFKGMRNLSKPLLYKIQGNKIERYQPEVIWWLRPWSKFQLMSRRFGYIGYLNILVVLLGTFIITSLDISKWYEGRYLKIYLQPHFYLLAVVNMVLVLGVYIYLAEKGIISYGNFLVAFGFAVGPSVLFKTTLFETPTGKSFGLGEAYKTLNTWITNQMTQSRHATLTPRVNVIAYYNHRKKLRKALLVIYRQQSKIPSDLQYDLDKELKSFEDLPALDRLEAERKVYARRLLRWKKWEQLKRKFIPMEFQKKRPLDPEVIISDVISYCRKEEKSHKIKSFLDKEMRKIQRNNQSWYDKIKVEHNEDIADGGNGTYDSHVRFLLLRLMILPSTLVKQQLLPEQYRLHRPNWIVGSLERIISSTYDLLRWIVNIPIQIIKWLQSTSWRRKTVTSKSGQASRP